MSFRHLGEKLRSFHRDVSGAMAVFIALTTGLLAVVAGLAVDGGQLYYQKRRLQTAADLAALASAVDLPRARDAAAASIARNGYARGNIVSLQTGVYTPSPAVAPAARFTPELAPSNAARLELVSNVSPMMARVMNLFRSGDTTAAKTVVVRARATAASEHRAAFSVGSRLLALDGGVLNALLGGLLGSKLSLSVMDYNALVGAQVDLFAFSQALATRLSLSAITFDELLAKEVRVSDVFAAASGMVDAAARPALYALSQDTSGAGRKVALGDFFSAGVYGSRDVSERPALAAAVSAMELVSLSAQAANKNQQVAVALQAGAPPIAAVSLQLAMGERPVKSGSVAVGAVGSSVHTAQTRLLLTVDLAGSGALSLLRLPIYIELASATARLKAISCPGGDPAQAQATIAAKPAIVDAWIGAVGAAEFRNFQTAPAPGPATLVNLLGLASVTSRAHVTLSNVAEKDVVFSAADVRNGVRKTVDTTQAVGGLLNGLLRDLDLNVNLLGVLALGLGDLDKSALNLLTTAAPAVDQLIAAVLRTLGLSLGQAEVGVSQITCGIPVLVN